MIKNTKYSSASTHCTQYDKTSPKWLPKVSLPLLLNGRHPKPKYAAHPQMLHLSITICDHRTYDNFLLDTYKHRIKARKMTGTGNETCSHTWDLIVGVAVMLLEFTGVVAELQQQQQRSRGSPTEYKCFLYRQGSSRVHGYRQYGQLHASRNHPRERRQLYGL